jgi:hypothetical protein
VSPSSLLRKIIKMSYPQRQRENIAKEKDFDVESLEIVSEEQE